MSRILAIILLTLAVSAWAEDEESAPPELIPIPEQPDIPEPVESGQPMQPEVTIKHRGKDTVEEYRVNNRLYMVKITPSIGPSYYLIDNDGDGQMESRRDITSGPNKVSIPQWVLFRW